MLPITALNDKEHGDWICLCPSCQIIHWSTMWCLCRCVCPNVGITVWVCPGVGVTGCHFVCVLESVCVNVYVHFFWNIPFVHVTYRSLCFCVNTKIWHSTHWKNVGVAIPWGMRVLCCSYWMVISLLPMNTEDYWSQWFHLSSKGSWNKLHPHLLGSSVA